MNDQPHFETPQHYLTTHPITLELMQRGVTEEHLAAIRFRHSNRERPFDQWSFTWGNGMPAEAIPFVMPYCTLKWLVLDDPPSSRDKEDAQRYVNDAMIAPIAAAGLNHKEAQRRRAQRSRVKVTEDGQTIKQVVERFVRKPEHREEGAPELWSPFFSELDQLELDPEEVTHSDLRKRHYEYAFGDKRRKISYGQFANLVSALRIGKSG